MPHHLYSNMNVSIAPKRVLSTLIHRASLAHELLLKLF